VTETGTIYNIFEVDGTPQPTTNNQPPIGNKKEMIKE